MSIPMATFAHAATKLGVSIEQIETWVEKRRIPFCVWAGGTFIPTAFVAWAITHGGAEAIDRMKPEPLTHKENGNRPNLLTAQPTNPSAEATEEDSALSLSLEQPVWP